MTKEIVILIDIAVACVLAGLLLYGVYRGWLNTKMLEGIRVIVSTFPRKEGSMVADIMRYAEIAVREVEQLVKTGQMEKDNEIRQNAAVEYVKDMLAVDYKPDAMEFVDDETIAAIVDAAVHELPRNQ